jgi:hypothetical protein
MAPVLRIPFLLLVCRSAKTIGLFSLMLLLPFLLMLVVGYFLVLPLGFAVVSLLRFREATALGSFLMRRPQGSLMLHRRCLQFCLLRSSPSHCLISAAHLHLHLLLLQRTSAAQVVPF